MRYLLLVLVFALVPRPCAAQDFSPAVKILGDLRIRSEGDDRDFRLSGSPNTYTQLRTRFGVDARPAENVRVFVMARDSRVFGSERDASGMFNTISDGKNLDLHQGYVEIGKFLTDDLLVRAGRQELSYGSERMIGAGGWNNIGRSFDGGLFRLNFPEVTADVLWMNIAEVHVPPASATPAAVAQAADDGQRLLGIYAQWKGEGTHRLDVYALRQGNRLAVPAGYVDFKRVTAGGFARGGVGGFVYEAEAAYQGGSRAGTDISAYVLAGLVGYASGGAAGDGFAIGQVAAGYEYLSGTAPGATEDNSFDPPFATAHKFHGFMDYFTNIPLHTANLGLTDLIGRVQARISSRLTAAAWYHRFNTAEEAGGEQLFGDEFDLTAKYSYAEAVSFEAGASAFLPGPLMRARFGSADTGIWGYVATTVTF